MAFPLPSPDTIARGMEQTLEGAVRVARPDATPAALARAVRAPQGIFAALIRTICAALYENHLHLRWWGDQYFPDSAEVEYLERHASIWGVFRRAPVKAVGNAQFAGLPGTVIPAGLQLSTPSGALVETLAASAPIDGTGLITVALRAVAGGSAANSAGGSTLLVVTVLPGLDPQAAVLDAGGLAGGADTEDDASLLDRLLGVIREPGHGGAAFDYPKWVGEAFAAAKVKTLPNWIGYGSVGVAVVMGTSAVPRVPTPAEIAAIAAHLETLRPVTAEVVVIAYVPKVVPVTVGLDPDTQANRSAVTAAINAFFAADARIGERLFRSRLGEAISAASGEYRHDLVTPAADVVCAPSEMTVVGAITFVAAS